MKASREDIQTHGYGLLHCHDITNALGVRICMHDIICLKILLVSMRNCTSGPGRSHVHTMHMRTGARG